MALQLLNEDIGNNLVEMSLLPFDSSEYLYGCFVNDFSQIRIDRDKGSVINDSPIVEPVIFYLDISLITILLEQVLVFIVREFDPRVIEYRSWSVKHTARG